MVTIYVDADACPVKGEIERVADRHGLRTILVSDGGIRPSLNPLIEVVTVVRGADAADDWIEETIAADDICVTNDIPLAARCLKKQAFAIRPNGEPFSQAGIGMTLATRDLMHGLRETGAITGGPRPFSKSDRSAFLNKFETMIQAAKRQAATRPPSGDTQS